MRRVILLNFISKIIWSLKISRNTLEINVKKKKKKAPFSADPATAAASQANKEEADA